MSSQNLKDQIDTLLVKSKAQPVGNGYIDIILHRDFCDQFIEEITKLGIYIEAISWWDYIPDDNQKARGMGGPKSKYFPGWYSELCIDLDELPRLRDIDDQIEIIQSLIGNKTIFDGVKYNEDKYLTAAFWLKVDNSWKNIF